MHTLKCREQTSCKSKLFNLQKIPVLVLLPGISDQRLYPGNADSIKN